MKMWSGLIRKFKEAKGRGSRGGTHSYRKPQEERKG